MNVTVRPSNISDASSVHRLLCVIADIHRNGREDIFTGFPCVKCSSSILSVSSTILVVAPTVWLVFFDSSAIKSLLFIAQPFHTSQTHPQP